MRVSAGALQIMPLANLLPNPDFVAQISNLLSPLFGMVGTTVVTQKPKPGGLGPDTEWDELRHQEP